MKGQRLIVGSCLLALLSTATLALTLRSEASPASSGTTLYVAADGNCGGMAPCYDAIQPAVDAASEGDSIRATQGVYTSTGFQVVHIDKSITLTGGYSAADWNTSCPVTQPSVIDAEHVDRRRAIYIDSGANTIVRLAGLTIKRGRAESGGGVYVHIDAGDQLTLTAEENRFQDNLATSGTGGALDVSAGNVDFTGNEFVSNWAEASGGALALGARTNSRLSANSFKDNSADSGGAIVASGRATVTGNIFESNSASHPDGTGGAVWIRQRGTIVSGNVFRDNYADSGGALQVDAWDVLISENLFEENTADGYGGALACDWADTYPYPALEANKFIGNEAEHGGAIFVTGGCNLEGTNDVIVKNQLTQPGAAVVVYGGLTSQHWTLVDNGERGIDCHSGGVSIRNSIVASHTETGLWASAYCYEPSAEYVLFHDNGEPYNEWVSCASCFAGAPEFIEPAAGDYHIGPGSAAVDRVDVGVTKDFDGQPRPMRSSFDLGADEQPPPPLASFTHSAPGWSGTPIVFTNTTVVSDLLSYLWDFGDGTSTKTVSPTHVYTSAGEYTVILTVTNYGGTSAVSDTLQVYGARFDTSTPDWLGQTSSFTNTTIISGTADYLWDFGDGTTTTKESPNHTYSVAGAFDVALTASNSVGSDLTTDTLTVYGPPTADFTAHPTEGPWPLKVAFADAATTVPEGDPTLSYSWSFGDGATSVSATPTHTYSASGVYTVSQTASNAAGADTLTRTAYVTVYEPVAADFSAPLTSGLVPLTVQFFNASTGDYTDTLWHFGDGATSTLTSPTHLYKQFGGYTVTLMVSGPGGEDMEIKENYVTVEAHKVYLPLVARGE